MPSYETLAITLVCVLVVYLIIRLLCGQGKKTPTPLQSQKEGAALKLDAEATRDESSRHQRRSSPQDSDNSSARREKRKQANSSASNNTIRPVGLEHTTSERTMGDIASTVKAEGKSPDGEVDLAAGSEEAPSSERTGNKAGGKVCGDEDDGRPVKDTPTSSTGAQASSGAEASVVAPPDDNVNTLPCDSSAVRLPVAETGDDDIGGASETAPPSSEFTGKEDEDPQPDGVSNKTSSPDDKRVADTTHASRIVRRNAESGSKRNKTRNSEDQVKQDRRHARLFKFDDKNVRGSGMDTGGGIDELRSQECPKTEIKEMGLKDNARESKSPENDEAIQNLECHSTAKDVASQSPSAVSGAVHNTLIADGRGPLPVLTSTPVKHAQELAVSHRQTPAGGPQLPQDTDQPESSLKPDASKNVPPQELSSMAAGQESGLPEVSDAGESTAAWDGFTVRCGVDSAKERKKSREEANHPKLTVDVGKDEVTKHLKSDQSGEQSSKSDIQREAARYKDYSRYLLKRCEAEVKQRERAEDWCEFLTSELDAHINARILTESKYARLVERTNAMFRQFRQLQKRCYELDSSVKTTTQDGSAGAASEDGSAGAMSEDGSADAMTRDVDHVEETDNTRLGTMSRQGERILQIEPESSPSRRLFSDLEEVRAAWQEELDTAAKPYTESVLSFYDFSALSSSYDDEGSHLPSGVSLSESAAHVAAGDATGASHVNHGQERTERAPAAVEQLDAVDSPWASQAVAAGKQSSEPRSEGSRAHSQNLAERASANPQPREENTANGSDESLDANGEGGPPKIQIVVAPSIQGKTAMWEEMLSGRSQLRESNDHRNEQDVLSASGGSDSIREARHRLEEQLRVANDASTSLSSSRCDLSEEMLGSIHKAKMLWEDRASISPPLSTHSSRRLSFAEEEEEEEEDNNNNSKRAEDSGVESVSQRTTLLGPEKTTRSPGSSVHSRHSSRLSLEDENDLGVVALEELTRTAEVSVQQSRLRWEERMQAASTSEHATDNDKAVCSYDEEEVECDASNEHISESVSSDSIGNVSQTKLMWEQALQEDEEATEGQPHQEERHIPKGSGSPREKRFSALKRMWEQPQED